MRISWRLFRYIARQLALAYATIITVAALLLFCKDLLEYGRKAMSRETMTFDVVVTMSALRVPAMVEFLTPISLFIAAMYVIWRMNRHHELDSIRGAGISIWQILLPAVTVGIAVNILILGIVNPIHASAQQLHDHLDRLHSKSGKRVFDISSVGVWMREADDKGQTVIHADRARNEDGQITLIEATALLYDGTGGFTTRVDAARAQLEDGFWVLRDALITRPGARLEKLDQVRLHTSLSLTRLMENVAEPETVSFWKLPDVIDVTEAAGISAIRYRVHWHLLLSSPLLYCALVLVGATFSLRTQRRKGTIGIVVLGLSTAFVVELLKYVMVILGHAGDVPVVLAAWATAGATMLFALGVLFQIEDG